MTHGTLQVEGRRLRGDGRPNNKGGGAVQIYFKALDMFQVDHGGGEVRKQQFSISNSARFWG